ncbi:Putative short-chain dehydrogenase/reductase SDR, NAD(P)-binding domain superfamily [Septoria linicola]|uniref:Short-chain dehydrogenase/reductase SDR, NAD(P)-binding domain superfamily n=1 Tax=Septoria linicola TaxID=215465 RepID=A0A9Q9EQH4_9PEZI|nr:Putative short-chain dehydrogenase/reductase SDR, NAD(P)-binding domain superfamily [Septoria linicola]
MSSSKGVFEIGFQPEVQRQDAPGTQKKLGPQPAIDQVPDGKGGAKLYQAAGKLEGKKALITGGDSGIGQSTAVLFAMEGADVFFTYLESEQKDADETVRLVEEKGRKAYAYPADLKSRDTCKKVVEAAKEKLGAINILFNNHAYQMMVESILDLSEDQWEETFNTNIHPFFYLSKYVLPHMSQGDTIINNASINAYIGRPDLLDYTSTKGAIVSFTRGLSNQFVGKGIRVNAVAPGPVWTPLIPATMNTDAIKQFTSPMGRPGQPSEIATCVVFLASTDSTQLSGQVIHANGGVIVNG